MVSRFPVCVTGSSGFLGNAVLDALLSEPALPVIPVSRSPSSRDGTVRVDRYDRFQPPPQADLIHLAEPPSFNPGSESTEAAQADRTLRHLLSTAEGHIVYASSVAVYGDSLEAPLDVDCPRNGKGAYAEMKIRHEDMVLERGGTVLRLTNLIGPGMQRNTVLGDAMAQLSGTGPIELRSLEPVRDYLPAEQAGQAFRLAVEKRIAGVFNIASGNAISVKDLVARLLNVMEQKGRAIQGHSRSMPSCIRPDIGLTKDRLGWHPTDALDSTLAALGADPRFSGNQ